MEKQNTNDFTLDCLPYGVFRMAKHEPYRIGVAYHEMIIDLHVLARQGVFDQIGLPPRIFLNEFLNPFMSLGKATTGKVRSALRGWIIEKGEHNGGAMHNRKNAVVKLPIEIGDYVDFYSSKDHASNVGALFRDPENALPPNWLYLPIGYHGRSSTIVNSGTPIHRPRGQIYNKDTDKPEFATTRALDFELEVAMIIGKESNMGNPVSIDDAGDYIFGLALFNDWSARDIQSWEYKPLGPFLGKSFASSIAPWIVPIEALQPFVCDRVEQDPNPLPYLNHPEDVNYDVELTVYHRTSQGVETVISNSNLKFLYWTFRQQLAHYTANGCNLKVGDVLATGTISGPEKSNRGCLLELTEAGKKPFKLSDGQFRTYLEDGDTIIMQGMAMNDKARVSFGTLENKII